MDLMQIPTMEEREVMETTMEEKAAMIQTHRDLEAGGEVSLTPALIHLEDLEAEREVRLTLMATLVDLAVESQGVEELFL